VPTHFISPPKTNNYTSTVHKRITITYMAIHIYILYIYSQTIIDPETGETNSNFFEIVMVHHSKRFTIFHTITPAPRFIDVSINLSTEMRSI